MSAYRSPATGGISNAASQRTADPRGFRLLTAQETKNASGGLSPLDGLLPLIQGGGSVPPKKKP